jgi:hypothetical protein
LECDLERLISNPINDQSRRFQLDQPGQSHPRDQQCHQRFPADWQSSQPILSGFDITVVNVFFNFVGGFKHLNPDRLPITKYRPFQTTPSGELSRFSSVRPAALL